MNEYFIKGNVPSLKNSKQWTGKLLISSKRVLEYERATRNQYQTAAPFIMNEFFGKTKRSRIFSNTDSRLLVLSALTSLTAPPGLGDHHYFSVFPLY